MRRIWLAIRIFFRTLFNQQAAERVAVLLDELRAAAAGALPPKNAPAGATPPVPEPPASARQLPAPAKPARSDALTLLAALQREARFIDFVQEPLEGYSDAQIGAAARDVHRECAKLLERIFALRPLVADPEGTELNFPAGYDPERYRLSGKVTDAPTLRGRLVHPGWQATHCDLPTTTTPPSAARIIAPAEVELR
jgi:hypothetical protein